MYRWHPLLKHPLGFWHFCTIERCFKWNFDILNVFEGDMDVALVTKLNKLPGDNHWISEPNNTILHLTVFFKALDVISCHWWTGYCYRWPLRGRVWHQPVQLRLCDFSRCAGTITPTCGCPFADPHIWQCCTCVWMNGLEIMPHCNRCSCVIALSWGQLAGNHQSSVRRNRGEEGGWRHVLHYAMANAIVHTYGCVKLMCHLLWCHLFFSPL